MTGRDTSKGESIRLLFELDRSDDPLLYDDLMGCRKGVRRANRLRLLAHAGVILEANLISGAMMPQAALAQPALSQAQSTDVGFEMPLASDVFGEPILGN